MALLFLFLFLGSISFIFLFWRRLKEDYLSFQIFSAAFYQLAGIILGVILSYYYLRTWIFWFSFLGAMFGLLIGVFRYKLKIVESFEASFAGLLVLLSWILLGLNFFFSNFLYYSLFLISLLMIGLFLFLDKHYKFFSWYKSGRIGFSGFATASVFFIILSLLAIICRDMLFFLGTKDIVLATGLAIFFSFFLYIISRKGL